VDWRADHTGRSFHLEASILDPTYEDHDTGYFPIAMHATLAAPDFGENLEYEVAVAR
jgi:hypothetical protein